MIISISIVTLIAIILIIGSLNTSFEFKKEVKTLFAETKIISDKKFNYSQLEGLPEPVQRYFNHILKEGQPYISYARIKHVGQFKIGIDKDWIKIRGEQYATTEKPGFIWKGTTSMWQEICISRIKEDC
jgi:hypothetical protein